MSRSAQDIVSAEQRYKFYRVARYLLAVPIVFLIDWWAAALILAGFADRRHAKRGDFVGCVCDFSLHAALVFVQKV